MNDYIKIQFGILFKIIISIIPIYIAMIYVFGLIALIFDTYIQIDCKEFDWGLLIVSVIQLILLPITIILYPVIILIDNKSLGG